MVQPKRKTGACLCGTVSVTVDVTSGISICHCEQCRKWSGGGPLHAVQVENPMFEGVENIVHFQASSWGERAFCKKCGTSLYWKMQNAPISSMMVGLLDDQTDLNIVDEIFVDCKAPWSEMYSASTKTTEAQEMVKFEAYMAKNKP